MYVWLDTDQDTGATVELGTLIFAKEMSSIAELRERVGSLERQNWRELIGGGVVQGPHHNRAALTLRAYPSYYRRGSPRESPGQSPEDVAEGAGGVSRPDPSAEAF